MKQDENTPSLNPIFISGSSRQRRRSRSPQRERHISQDRYRDRSERRPFGEITAELNNPEASEIFSARPEAKEREEKYPVANWYADFMRNPRAPITPETYTQMYHLLLNRQEGKFAAIVKSRSRDLDLDALVKLAVSARQGYPALVTLLYHHGARRFVDYLEFAVPTRNVELLRQLVNLHTEVHTRQIENSGTEEIQEDFRDDYFYQLQNGLRRALIRASGLGYQEEALFLLHIIGLDITEATQRALENGHLDFVFEVLLENVRDPNETLGLLYAQGLETENLDLLGKILEDEFYRALFTEEEINMGLLVMFNRGSFEVLLGTLESDVGLAHNLFHTMMQRDDLTVGQKEELAEFFLKNGTVTPPMGLLEASYFGDIILMGFFHQKGADNVTAALLPAVVQNNEAAVNYLLALGADPTAAIPLAFQLYPLTMGPIFQMWLSNRAPIARQLAARAIPRVRPLRTMSVNPVFQAEEEEEEEVPEEAKEDEYDVFDL